MGWSLIRCKQRSRNQGLSVNLYFSRTKAGVTNVAYRAVLARHGRRQSMRREGNCFENAVIESFFASLKAKYLHLSMRSSTSATATT